MVKGQVVKLKQDEEFGRKIDLKRDVSGDKEKRCQGTKVKLKEQRITEKGVEWLVECSVGIAWVEEANLLVLK
jgi:hypothetical protein